MKKTDYFGFGILLMGIAFGIWLGGFAGGGFFGIFLEAFCLAVIGKVKGRRLNDGEINQAIHDMEELKGNIYGDDI